MLLLHTSGEFREWRSTVNTLILVPTMGALHEGHLELMRVGRQLAGPEGKVGVSIFVNPLQFGPNEDLDKYPRELDSDADKCRSVGVDVIFAPTADTIYAPDRSVTVLESALSKQLCGASRPGHFDGVCTVVLKLFNIMQPDTAVFGKKDFQQLAIIHRMVRDLNVPVDIHAVETIREADGLAMSSRNRYLSDTERQQAPAIRRALLAAHAKWQSSETNAATLLETARQILDLAGPAHLIDYLKCVNRDTLESVQSANADSLLAAAVYFGKTRLIDNIELA